ncbi:MAG TPA: hypothetical protein VGP46_04985 [Acidimicrobiales bacterium]|jgi:hypothetical protein|nr:hypothetical protein [Acidimicrobiales bacterium]
MTLVTISTIKGAPGCTTLALLLAKSIGDSGLSPLAGSSVLLLECDPAGGDVGPRLDLPGVPGLASLALVARHGFEAEAVGDHTQSSPRLPGADLLLGVAGPEQGIALEWMFQPLALMVAEDRRWVIADLGRLSLREGYNDEFRSRASVNLLVTADRVASLLQVRAAVEACRRRDVDVHLVLSGERLHPIPHVERTTGAGVLGTLRNDPAAIAHLLGRSSRLETSWRRSRLWPRRASSAGVRADVAGLFRSLRDLVETTDLQCPVAAP